MIEHVLLSISWLIHHRNSFNKTWNFSFPLWSIKISHWLKTICEKHIRFSFNFYSECSLLVGIDEYIDSDTTSISLEVFIQEFLCFFYIYKTGHVKDINFNGTDYLFPILIVFNIIWYVLEDEDCGKTLQHRTGSCEEPWRKLIPSPAVKVFRLRWWWWLSVIIWLKFSKSWSLLKLLKTKLYKSC